MMSTDGCKLLSETKGYVPTEWSEEIASYFTTGIYSSYKIYKDYFLKFRIGSDKNSRQAQAPPCMHISFTVVLVDDPVESITSNILFNHRNRLVMIAISPWKRILNSYPLYLNSRECDRFDNHY
jgi:hypothetical protein